MTTPEIIARRLANQQISGTGFKTPEEIVEWMCAIQAQEYAMAKWALGLRLPGTNDAQIEKAFNDGKILRTHLLRPTWHFVSPKDIHWLLELTGPRIHIANNFMCRKLGLDNNLIKKSVNQIVKLLEEKEFLTRDKIREELTKKNIAFDGSQMSHMMMHAELEGIICSGPRQGKQFTYALLEKRAGKERNLTRSESLVELSNRYFKSRGPATIKDFTLWSGLTVKDAKEGIAGLRKNFIRETIDGNEYIFPDNKIKLPDLKTSTFLMPSYDEYAIGYKNRDAIYDEAVYKKYLSRGNPVFDRMIIINGVIEGTWQRTFIKNKAVVETFPFVKLNPVKQKLLKQAVDCYVKFTGNEMEE
jgi:hypothetical protein